ncbi:hypothetical protein ACEPAH_9598 [Sanghuangporus vaninii]
MGLIMRAMAKKLAADNGVSEVIKSVTADEGCNVVDRKNTAVNVDTVRDVSGNRISANGGDTEANEVLNPEIHIESEPIHTRPPHSTNPESSTTTHGRGKKAICSTQSSSNHEPSISRLTEPLSSKSKSSTWIHSTNNSGDTLKDTGIATMEQKRGREETYVVDSQTVEGTSPNAQRIRRKGTTANEASSHGSNLREPIKSCRKVKADGGLSMPEQYGTKPKPADMHSFDSLFRLAIVSSEYLQEEKEK